MKKYFFAICLLIVALNPVFSEEKPIITVLDFTTNNISNNDMNSIISLLSSALFRSDVFTVIDVNQRTNILDELEFANSGCSNENCQLEIGKLLSAEMIVVGDIAKVGSRFILTTKMMTTETGRTLETFDGIYADIDDLVDNVFVIADRFGGHIESSISDVAFETPEVSIEDGESESIPIKTEPLNEMTETSNASAEQESGIENDELKKIRDESENSVAADDIMKINPKKIAAYSTLAAGLACSGVGGYFIYNAFQYNTSTLEPSYNAYEAAVSGDDFSTLWSAYEVSFTTFQTKSALATGLAAGGVVMLGVSAILFILDNNTEHNVDVAFNYDPVKQASCLSATISY